MIISMMTALKIRPVILMMKKRTLVINPLNLNGIIIHAISKVASIARVDVSRKMTIENLAGVDTVVTFRPEKHGEGFRYVANG
ncbi:hypothetical protein Hanom_Chr00s000004g01609631 [Helianthus anomalus]